ncbi:MAG: MarR family winged helix-turn-helix transcriptional regulator [Gammaproteobacteria bacterium]|nr:MarR family winged helix-turn-helix transcriptional regulator [Gammaproteobacteria bacterium]
MARQTPGLNLNEFLPYRLSIVTNRISAAFARLYAEKFDLSIHEWRVMAVLGQRPGLSADEVCGETEMDKVPVSRAVTKLLDKGLLNREFSGTDRRRSILSLSEAGDGVYAQIVPLALGYEVELKAALTDAEQAQLDVLLAKLGV